MVDWTPVLVALVAGLPGIVAAVLAYMNRRWLRTPSGGTVGYTAETALDLAAVSVGTTQAVLAHVTGDQIEAERIVAQLGEQLQARQAVLRKRG